MTFAEASRAKHKFAVKRNSWPKTRGVAMNPVDHVSTLNYYHSCSFADNTNSLTEVVTINISVKPRQYHATPLKDKKLVSLLLGEQVYSAVLKRLRIRGNWRVASEECIEEECMVYVLRVGCSLRASNKD